MKKKSLIQKENEKKVLTAYWSGNKKLSEIPANCLSHINYAFAYIDKEGRVHPDSSYREAEEDFKQLNEYKKKYPHLKTSISIGGWGRNSTYFSDIALTEESREEFAQATIDQYIKKYEFDGIDLDWEFPVKGGVDDLRYRPEDKKNFNFLVREFRKQLDQLGKERERSYLLTAATPAGRYQNTATSGGPYDPADSYDFQELAKYLDLIYIMTYDLGNGYNPVVNFNAGMRPLSKDPTPSAQKRWNNLEGSVDYYLNQGVPRNKLVVGTPFYGRSFYVKSTDQHGLFQKFHSPGPTPDWLAIKNNYLNDPNWEKHWEEKAEVPWLFHSEKQLFLSYDNPYSIRKKAEFIVKENLRGGMIWHLSMDDAENSLLHALAGPILENKEK
ncbi:MAG: glycoside hydrolase family 18 protein [Atopostipes sp.]|nr:glycoside hydrolase family 18 protein [Atopostipes sp.]